ncbi:MAG: LPS-assembly protein LptD [Treponema sp.]|nr:LPS-assembly protein LptD [Treponema sp.]
MNRIMKALGLNNARFLKSFFAVILMLFAFIPCSFAQSTKSVINIINADKTEYVKNSETGEEEIVLTGSVSLKVTQDKTETTITASKITYNRKSSMIYASGSVSLKQTGGADGTQNISAETLLLNTETLEGIFDGGKIVQLSSDAINLPSGSSLIVSSELFGKTSENAITFKNATLSFCDDEDEPHWKIKSSRLWLLPGGEFAFLNSVLYVGNVPVMYLPAFYYPKDELIFNPTFGYDVRKGYFINSTTYLLGRKPLDSEKKSGDDSDVSAALFNFIKPSKLKEQKREGLVLHNLDEDYTGNTSAYLKIMADYYTNLGGMIGLQGSMAPNSVVSTLEGALQIGFSNTVFYDSLSETYMPYAMSGTIYSDHSNFMGFELPFRYGGDFNLSISKPFSLRLSMPFYSDPFFQDDFRNRSESMDWISFLMSSEQDSKNKVTASTVSSFTWNAEASYSIPLPESIKPYVSNLSISSLSSSLTFNSKQASISNTDLLSIYSPERMFYYPSQLSPFKISTQISGTIFKYSSSKTVEASKQKTDFPIVLELPDDLRENEAENKSAQEKEEDKKTKAPVLPETALPLLDSKNSLSVTTMPGIEYALTYSISPQFTSQINYLASSIAEPSDFSWDKVQSSFYQIKSPATISSKFSYRGSFFTMNNDLSFNPSYQTHPRLDGYTDSSAASIKKSDYSAFSMDLTGTNSLVLKPLLYTDMFKNTSLTWNTTAKIIRTEFTGTEDDPEWKYYLLDLTDEKSITQHSFSLSFSSQQSSSLSQTLTLTTKLPPQLSSYDASLALNFPYVNTSFSTGVYKTKNSDGSVKWNWNFFRQNASLNLFSSTENKLSLTESFSFDWEKWEASAFKLVLNYRNLSVSYSMSTTFGYDFNSTDGWVARTEKEFLPESLSLSYDFPAKTFKWWKNRISFTPDFSTSLVFDLIRPTNSYFRFVPSISFKINKFIDLTFSSETRNSSIYRYFQGIGNSDIELPGETNVFVDLFNSFAFWGDGAFYDSEQTLRKSSGFKLKNLKVTVKHDLHDWDFSASFAVTPRLITTGGRREYNFDPYMTVSIVWRPMGGIKTEIVDEYGDVKLNP